MRVGMMSILFGIVIAALVVSVMLSFVSDASEQYGFKYNDSNFSSFQKVDDINNNAEDAVEKLRNASSNPDLSFDKVFAFVGAGVSGLKTIASSFDLAIDMASDGTSQLPVENNKTFQTTFVTLILIILLGLFITAMIKTNLG